MKRIIFILMFIALLTTGCASSAIETTPPPRIDTGVDPESWSLIPAGEFLENFNNNVVMVVYDYEMMVTDVTNAQYAGYLNEAMEAGATKIVGEEVVGYYPGDIFRAYRHEEEITPGDYFHIPLDGEWLRLDFDGTTFTTKSGYENHPMVAVTWFGAKAYCDFYGWRLPTDFEWEKAARGTDGLPYPWGDDIQRNNANFYSSRDPFEEVVGRLGDTTPVGFYNGQTHLGYQTLDSPSPYGLYDMAGNVWQWLGNVYPNQHYRYMRGGGKDARDYKLRVWEFDNAEPIYFSPNVGFRCARDY